MDVTTASRRIAAVPFSRIEQFRARAKSLLRRAPLPPGGLVGLDVIEKSSRSILLHEAAAVGPIFKVVAYRELWICVVGLALGRQLLRAHADALLPVTLDLQTLFGSGFMRQMTGDTHRHYRRALIKAMGDDALSLHEALLRTVIREELMRHSAAPGLERDSAEAYLATLSRIATTLLVAQVFGAVPGSPLQAELVAGFGELGPHGLVWNIGERQRRAYARLCEAIRRHCESGQVDTLTPAGILRGALRDGALDDHLLGNLIYMVEMGRYDLRAMFRWLSRYSAIHPGLARQIADEAAPSQRRALAEAFVLETLRLDQSERLLRIVQKDFVFQGLLFPAGSTVRVCMWESHKDEAHFEEPFQFRPGRFLQGDPGGDRFSPFGLDHHHCPFSQSSVRMGRWFVEELVTNFAIEARHDGPSVRGAYHWEPASGFTVGLTRRRNLG